MALRVMSAIVPPTGATDHEAVRQKLQEDLLAAAKSCHARFGGKAELATESDICVSRLCVAFEQILSHGLKSGGNRSEKINTALRQVSEFVSGSPKSSGYAFWPHVKQLLTCHEQERFSVLKKVCSDFGRGRAWLRAALNERSLEKHLHSVIGSDLLMNYYENWAFLLQQDKACMLPNIAAGLTTILFAIRVDNEELNDALDDGRAVRSKNSLFEPIISDIPEPTGTKTKKKVPTHIINFDDEDENPKICINKPDTPPCTSKEQKHDESVVILDVSTLSWDKSLSNSTETFDEERLLTPLTDPENMGGLVPVSPLDGALDDMLVSLPTYSTEEEAETAVEATEPLINLNYDAETLDADALRIRLSAMNEILDQAKEESISSKLQLARFQRQHQNHLEKHELQIQTLNRENELLRQQLRKYVTAVQMLKNEPEGAHEENSLDYHKESQQYQEKLVQVAEMHAELMEFNNRLTMQLNNKDKLLKMLQAELECLRGPMSEEDMPAEPPCLIHIWIPSAFLTGQPSDIHHVYQIYVRIRDTEWNIYRRYAQFYNLYRELKRHDSIITSFEFPPKKTIGNKDAKFVEDRRQKLQLWLRRIVGRLSHCSPAFLARPAKETLITLIPFFGDLPAGDDGKRNSSSRNASMSSPQYMGL